MQHLHTPAPPVTGPLGPAANARPPRAAGASIYVGDHIGDVRGARAARAYSVAVTTGPCTAEELRAAGADTVLPDLTAFPNWLTQAEVG
ncbi:HAD family hydrolase [Nocardia wallacei]|uniref:HAD family hydrolase n=1 Tax=Nocardia wallacei TaxID=480035 RepID=UPI00313BD7CA